MCLATKMSPKKKAEFKEQTEGWKVLLDRSGEICGDWFGQTQKREIGRWLNEKLYCEGLRPLAIRYSYRRGTYELGWHIWLTIEGAKKWAGSNKYKVIRKVKFRKPVAYGRQNRHPVVVAKEMMILKEAQ